MDIIVSIIVPVFNCKEYIASCIESLINQSHKSLEIILIDDGSTDESGIICDAFALKDNRIKVFHLKNGGVSSARNFGINVFQGDYITFVDSDDLISQIYIEVLLSLMKESNADISMVDFVKFRHTVEVVPERKFVHEDFAVFTNEEAKLQFFKNKKFGNIGGKMFKRGIVEKGRFNPTIFQMEDSLFLYDAILKASYVVWSPIKAYFYRVNSNSATHYFNKKSVVSIDSFVNTFFSNFKDSLRERTIIKSMLFDTELSMLNVLAKNKSLTKNDYDMIKHTLKKIDDYYKYDKLVLSKAVKCKYIAFKLGKTAYMFLNRIFYFFKIEVNR